MDDPKPICFMIMPFDRKTVSPQPSGAPASIDFDALWHKALAPTIRTMGYEPVRADQDTGASIIQEMLERLYFSDLVLADMTLPNANVYYEVGIRHACNPAGCVLVSAAWAQPVFDVRQLRRITYPLSEGDITDEAAAAIQQALLTPVSAIKDGPSPMHQFIPGYPDVQRVDPQRASAIQSQLNALSRFQAQARAVKLESDAADRKAKALQFRDEHAAAAALSPSMACEVIGVLRDTVGFQESLSFIESLPDSLRKLEAIEEQRCLAMGKVGQPLEAIAALEQLIHMKGPSSERHGLIGGRYKKLASEAKKKGDAVRWRGYLDNAIEHYELGMQCDLNDYFPSCNLPRLYKDRADEDDEQKAATAAAVAMAACRRAQSQGSKDEWLRPTLLGLAFGAGDLAQAKRLVSEVRREGPAAWKLETTLTDLETSIGQMTDAAQQAAFKPLLDALRAVLDAVSVQACAA